MPSHRSLRYVRLERHPAGCGCPTGVVALGWTASPLCPLVQNRASPNAVLRRSVRGVSLVRRVPTGSASVAEPVRSQIFQLLVLR
jgi:hypothetical protein